MGKRNHPRIDMASVAQGCRALTADTDYDDLRGYCVSVDGTYNLTFDDDTTVSLYRIAGVDYGAFLKSVNGSPPGTVFGYT